MTETAWDRKLEAWASAVLAGAEPGRERWRDVARPNQLPPPGDWFIWLLLTGRGWGKTRTETEWLDERARGKKAGEQVLVAGRTPADLRDYALYGPGGLLTHHPDVEYLESKRKLVWPNGVVGLVRSGANPEEFRGYSGDTAVLDEFAAWDYPDECWSNLTFGMREGDPKIVVGTTPKPRTIIRQLLKWPDCVVTRGTSYENAANLAESWRRNVLDPVEGTRKGRQEVQGELLEDLEGALWRLADIDRMRGKASDLPKLLRQVVAVDPQGTKTSPEDDIEVTDARGNVDRVGRHETGIVAVAYGADKRFYVLEDASLNGTPLEWGSKAVAVYDRHKADRIIAETNYGGDMVESTVRSVRKEVAFEKVTATRGKVVRAEPVSARYEKGEVVHVGYFPALEEQQTSYVGDGASPNRLDALVWGMTWLMEKANAPRRRLTF